jgi:hypothetical protein
MKQPISQRNHFINLGSTMLQTVFIVLKLTGTVAWSWWWVLSPFWISACLAALLIVTMILMRRFEDRAKREAAKALDHPHMGV